jgi:pyrroline-5-carboxylate reductase
MDNRVAVLGSGQMGGQLAIGMVASGAYTAGQIYVSDKIASAAQALAAEHGFNLSDNVEAVTNAGTVVVAVKPQDVGGLLADIGEHLSDQLILSVAAGVPTEFFEDRLARTVPVVRAMPNICVRVLKGMSAITPGRRATEQHLEVAARILGGVGRVVRVDEKQMDAVTALSGSGPAYFCLFVEALTDAGVMTGLPRALAAELVLQTMVGTAGLLSEGAFAPEEARRAVTSPGGTTAMALAELERAGVRAAVLDAVAAARDRSAEMLSAWLKSVDN